MLIFCSTVPFGNAGARDSVTGGMYPEFSSLMAASSRFSRREWIAIMRLFGCGVLLWSLSACVAPAGRTRAAVVVRTPPPPPAVVVTEPPRAAEKVVYVQEAPPPLRREVIVERERPSKAHLWIAGHWRHDGRAYFWVPGHWERPPRPRAVWVEPRWEHRDGVYVFVEGVWR